MEHPFDVFDGRVEDRNLCRELFFHGERRDGAEVGEFPCSSASLARAVPRYEHLEGWRDDISRCTSFGELPKNARDYVRYVEAAVGTPVIMVGVGPGREQTILLDA